MSSLPYIVIQAQKLARTSPELKGLLKETLMKLSLLEPTERIEFIFREIDYYLSLEAKGSACVKGCHFCCFHPITVTNEEAKVLKKHNKNADLNRLTIQKNHFKNDSLISYNDRACVFLKDGSCSVYEDRPIICRLTHVKSDPADCHLENGVNEIEHLPVSKASIVAAAFLMSSTDREFLPLSLEM